MKRRVAACILAAIAPFAIGCGGGEGVVRVVDGRAVEGDFVPPQAYAAYLRGAIAEAGGRLDEAIAAYEAAAEIGPSDPEPWARLGLARCARDARDGAADRAIDRALAIDEAYAPAWEAKARCEALRHPDDPVKAAEDARRALAADPRATAALATLARVDPGADATSPTARATRERLLAATLAEPTDRAAWQALATWGALHGDAGLEARALAQLFALAPPPRTRAGEAIRRLAGEGALAEARSLARAAVLAGDRAADVGLAIDDAIALGDRDEVLRVVTRGRTTRATAAARALLWGDARLARSLIAPVVGADPKARDARVVLAAAADALGDRAALAAALRGVERTEGALGAEAWLVYARMLARRGSPDAARALAPLRERGALPDGDPLVTPAAVALAAQGVLDASALGPNARIELAERRGERVDPRLASEADARHRLLALARFAPNDGPTRDLARRLAPYASRDRVVAVAFARLALAGAPSVAHVDEVIARLDPADPLVAAAALDLALRANDTRVIPLARARLAAVARTPAEIARLH